MKAGLNKTLQDIEEGMTEYGAWNSRGDDRVTWDISMLHFP